MVRLLTMKAILKDHNERGPSALQDVSAGFPKDRQPSGPVNQRVGNCGGHSNLNIEYRNTSRVELLETFTALVADGKDQRFFRPTHR